MLDGFTIHVNPAGVEGGRLMMKTGRPALHGTLVLLDPKRRWLLATARIGNVSRVLLAHGHMMRTASPVKTSMGVTEMSAIQMAIEMPAVLILAHRTKVILAPVVQAIMTTLVHASTRITALGTPVAMGEMRMPPVPIINHRGNGSRATARADMSKLAASASMKTAVQVIHVLPMETRAQAAWISLLLTLVSSANAPRATPETNRATTKMHASISHAQPMAIPVLPAQTERRRVLATIASAMQDTNLILSPVVTLMLARVISAQLVAMNRRAASTKDRQAAPTRVCALQGTMSSLALASTSMHAPPIPVGTATTQTPLATMLLRPKLDSSAGALMGLKKLAAFAYLRALSTRAKA